VTGALSLAETSANYSKKPNRNLPLTAKFTFSGSVPLAASTTDASSLAISKGESVIPTVSRWLGHQDGGALCMKTYGHLRDEHSQAQTLKVAF
jgi:hypothetical protein